MSGLLISVHHEQGMRRTEKICIRNPVNPLLSSFIKYGQMHFLSTGIKANRETHPFVIIGFIAVLEPKLNKMVARKYADVRVKPNTLEAIFQMAEKMLQEDVGS